MKIWKKTLALVMALGMTVGFVACGGGDKEPAGEQLDANGGWAAAWEATLTATNVTAEGTYSYSLNAGENIWQNMESEGTVQLADGKIYSEGTYTMEWDYTGQGHGAGKNSGVTKSYTGMRDGALCEWYYNEETKEWEQMESQYDADTFGTAFCLVEVAFDIEMDRYDYAEWEALAVYADGVYTLAFADEDDSETYQFKFVDGKLYSVTATTAKIGEEGYTQTFNQSYVFTYGEAEVGKLPYEEGFGEEEGEDVGGGTVGGEEIGGEVVDGASTLTQAEWEAIVESSCEATNLTATATDNENGSYTVESIVIADNKLYSCMEEQATDSTKYEYIGEVDGVFYVWRSSDGETWARDTYVNLYEEVITEINGSYFFAAYGENLDASTATYHKETGKIVFTLDMYGAEMTMYFNVQDGKIVQMKMVTDGFEGVLLIQYGNAYEIELPTQK